MRGCPLRVGSVPYLVGRPVDSGLDTEPGIELVREVPAQLVEGLRSGRLDVALVSSIELFRRPGYRYLDRIAVAGRGFVGSVQVFLRRPLEELRALALDPASRTAATLVRVLLGEDGLAPEMLEVERGVDPRGVRADAWLRIGDRALREYLGEPELTVFNPSQAWCARRGLPFVFAAWIVAPGADVEPHLAAFERARRRGADGIEALAREASAAWSLGLEDCRRYLTGECEYELASGMHAALTAFRDAAGRLDLCDARLALRPIDLEDVACRG